MFERRRRDDADGERRMMGSWRLEVRVLLAAVGGLISGFEGMERDGRGLVAV